MTNVIPDGAEPRVVDHGVPDVGAVGGRVGEVAEGGVVLVRLPKHLGDLQNLKGERAEKRFEYSKLSLR